MRNKQTGVSLTGLIIVFAILIVLALIGFKVGPAFSEFFTAKNLIKIKQVFHKWYAVFRHQNFMGSALGI